MSTPMSTASTLAGDKTAPADLDMKDPTIIESQADSGGSSSSSSSNLENCDESAPAHNDEKNVVIESTDDNIVEWDGPNDPECPRNWPAGKKVAFVIATSAMIVAVSFGSSVFAPAEKVTAAQFGVSLTVMQLTVALWILGFFAGPIFFGPLSEIFGHLIPLTVAMTGLAIFQIPIAMGGSVQTILICRFFSGAFGSGVFAVVSGMYVELYEPIPRGIALALSSICINLGATIAPVAGAYLTAEASWRWTAWVTLIYAGLCGIMGLFAVRESSSRAILRTKAARMRFDTQNWALHARSEEQRIELQHIVQRYLTKPIRMFVTEPILIVFTVYLTLVYGTLYLSFQAFPMAFQQRGWTATTSSLPFLAVMLGILSAWGVTSIFTLTWYKRVVLSTTPTPEHRLPPMMLGGVLLPPSLLWFGWSGATHWFVQVLASYFVGLSLMLIFISGIVYIVDVYQVHANSAMSIHVVVRSLIACSFPLFANIMYEELGVAWASSLLAFLCVALAPVPFAFYYYGKTMRGWSRFSFTM
ncbi:MFS multidrug transporter [Pseudomassariella vexata]|uniref:MFS multidrug transporter n=1 Tax=Pseudomassariella vexata TaxID=1141098 RepID=A0A1Y2EI97_9PEZI|nr:MFS multidrug transporter [Pseudomassariella vexata]ORY71024.1 MFS multidrug transporter [Pseudomassariella vexata]